MSLEKELFKFITSISGKSMNLDDMKKEMDKAAGEFFGKGGAFDKGMEGVDGVFSDMTSMFKDLELGANAKEKAEAERANPLRLSFGFPGVPKDKVKLQVENRHIIVSAECKKEDAPIMIHGVSGCRGGSVTKKVKIGKDYNLEGIDAEYKDGLLILSIPLKESAKKQSVDIK